MSCGNDALKRIFRSISRIIRSVGRILSSDLPRSLKQSVLWSYLFSIELKLFGRDGRPLNIVGNWVRYLRFPSLVFQFHEIFVELQYNLKLDTTRPFIIDCGSNIGMSLVFFKALYPEAEILAFEPDPGSYECLLQNIEVNKLKDVQALKLALSEEEGQVDFYIDPDRPGSLLMSTIQDRMPHTATRVPSGRLSTFIDRSIDLVKMDIEGAELTVIKELSYSGRMAHVNNFLIEYHHHIDTAQDEFGAFLSLLEESGYGYQIRLPRQSDMTAREYQDLVIFAYRK